jgi:hypothetical protein
MAERAIIRVWWIITMSLIALTAMGALLTAYRSVFNALAGAYVDGARQLLYCLPLAAAAYLLMKHRCDLVGD